MTSNQITKLMNREPFVDLKIKLADGGSVRVEEPFEIATKWNSCFCVVYDSGKTTRFIAVRNTAEIVTDPAELPVD